MAVCRALALLFFIIAVMLGRHRGRPRYRAVAAVVTAALALAACGSGGADSKAAPPPTTPPSIVPTTSPPAPPTTRVVPTTMAPASFTATVSTVTTADVPHTWRPGCPVGPSQLRLLHLTYWGFDGRSHPGTMVVNAGVVDDVITVFRTLYDEHFPIEEMVPEDAYDGNDNAAAAADDTSGYNCRFAVASGPPQWSVHAYGEAIDVNDVQNPYVYGGTTIPPAGATYLDRSDVRPGMAVPGGELVRAFASVGWFWGGRWTASPDYQHFSLTGG